VGYREKKGRWGVAGPENKKSKMEVGDRKVVSGKKRRKEKESGERSEGGDGEMMDIRGRGTRCREGYRGDKRKILEWRKKWERNTVLVRDVYPLSMVTTI
jgi:hypothetical protein